LPALGTLSAYGVLIDADLRLRLQEL